MKVTTLFYLGTIHYQTCMYFLYHFTNTLEYVLSLWKYIMVNEHVSIYEFNKSHYIEISALVNFET